MKTLAAVQYRIYFQNRYVTVALNPTLIELLALQLGEYPGTANARFTVQRWLGIAVRHRFGAIVTDDAPVETWARLCLQEAVINREGVLLKGRGVLFPKET
ncbi:hypothetical protein [Thiothrix sp.]|jgi:hypothetical protein|uniref:hypothetical protein n=1 Tax=Thiothrix sp. TaxID=1032 RepID=UPI00257EBB87|nr:hypothetical protein [Thiothrix sp.]